MCVALPPAVQPHDRLFRAVFSAPENAEGLLRAALSEGVASRIDWTALSFLPTSVIDTTLREARTDLLFGAKLDGRPALIYLLLEHQSEPDLLMPLLARVPIAAMLDLNQAADDELRMQVLTAIARAALLCLTKIRGSTNVIGVLERFREVWLAVLRAPSGVAALAQICSYILGATQASRSELQPFFQRLGEGAKEALMTGADMLRAEGKAEGRVEGRAEGRVEGRAEVLERLLGLKFGAVSVATRERLRTASLDELDRWAERLLAAASLEEVFDTRR